MLIMSFNLTTDDVWDEAEKLGCHKPSKPNKRKIIKKIIDNNGNIIFEGNLIERKMFLKKHFKLTARWLKKGRLNTILKDKGYLLV